MFTCPVKAVTNTRIFTRSDEGGRQFVVYSMKLDAPKDVAMVLPLPVAENSGEKAVNFISLKAYPDFFDGMAKGFPSLPTPVPASLSSDSHNRSKKLEVVQVGNFEASFVPTEKDFSRLDERFRLPKGTWDKLPMYKQYGFAVFKLKPGNQQLHPMAFSFPRRAPALLFFPTVHIHDGKVHKIADFDHELYCQPRETEAIAFDEKYQWIESHGHPANFMKPELTQGIVLPDQHCYKTELHGDLPNRDVVIALET